MVADQVVPNIFLIVCLGIIPALLLFFSFIFIVAFSSPDDRFQGILPKILCIFGMTVAGCIILIIPFDVWNTQQAGGITGVLEIIWQVLFGTVALLICLIIPWALLYYESFDPDKEGPRLIIHQCIWGTVGAICVFIFAGLIIGISYIWLGNAYLPVVQYTSTGSFDEKVIAVDYLTGQKLDYINSSLEIRMSFLVYAIAILSLIGWCCFTVCGGCGMTALPLEMILWFIYRPKKIDKSTYLLQQKKYAQRAQKLIEIGKKINDQRREGIRERTSAKAIRTYREFKDAVYQVEDDFKKVKIAYERGGGWIVLYIISLLAGLLMFAISILWIIHLIIYAIPQFPFWGGLNDVFRGLDYAFPLFGMIGYSIFAFYLLAATVAGNIFIAGRIPFCAIYPIKFKDTFTSSFLFNTGLMLVSSITIVQFCSTVFSKYAQTTVIEVMINTYVKHMLGIGYVFKYLHYVFFAFIFIGFVMAIVNIAVKKRKSEKQLQAILDA
ncbi:hypothetical protein ABK040_001803 [Willaertia magna]